jgi:hypothetical protein
MPSRRIGPHPVGASGAPIYLHIGAMKTGTTYLQDLMTANRSELAEAGYLFPGERWSDQSRAARDILGMDQVERPLHPEAEPDGPWAAVVEQMRAHRGAASVFSMEFLSFAGPEVAARIVDSFGGADVHVVLTVRDAVSTIPAQWQTSCRNGGKVPWRRFVYGVQEALEPEDPERTTRGRAIPLLRRTQAVDRMLEAWVPLVGADRVHVVTVPPRGSDPGELWRRFASVVGVDPAVCTQPVPGANPSLGHPSTELLRRVNIALGSLPSADYVQAVKGPVARKILGSRASSETPIRLHRRGTVFAVRWNRLIRSAIVESGVHVVGDLDDLTVAPPPAELPKTLYRPSDDELLEAAATGRDGLLAFEQHLTALADQPPAGDPEHRWVNPRASFAPDLAVPVTTAHHWDSGDAPVDAAVEELAARVHACVALLHRIEAQRVVAEAAPAHS